MAFKGRRELLFIYSVKDANPNGDPLNANHPRYDDDSGQILVSDVRVKRTVRDQWIREGKDVFVDGETKTLKQRVAELKEKFGVGSGEEALARCIDTRLFGVTFALDKESFSWTGPVQFKWGRSLHRAEVLTVQGTAAFATKEDSGQRSFRNEYIVPFALIADYAIANQYASETTNASEGDLDSLFAALWAGTSNLITRSKVGHVPRFLLEIRYREGFDGMIGALDEKVSMRDKNGKELSSDAERAARSCDAVLLDTSRVAKCLERVFEDVEALRIVRDISLPVTGLDEIVDRYGGKLILEQR